jgi:hypothetical protein
MKLADRQCVWCGGAFTPVRVDQRFDRRQCLYNRFVAERKRALVAYRAQQHMARATEFFNQRSDDADEAA